VPDTAYYYGMDFAACVILEREIESLPLLPEYSAWLTNLVEDQDNVPDIPQWWSGGDGDARKALSMDHLDPGCHKAFRIRTKGALNLAWMMTMARKGIRDFDSVDKSDDRVAEQIRRYWRAFGDFAAELEDQARHEARKEPDRG